MRECERVCPKVSVEQKKRAWQFMERTHVLCASHRERKKREKKEGKKREREHKREKKSVKER